MLERDLFISSMECALQCSQHRDLLQRYCKSEDPRTLYYITERYVHVLSGGFLRSAVQWQFSWEVEEEKGWRKRGEGVIFRRGGG